MIAKISTRSFFNSSSTGWREYIEWIQLTHLAEIRTIDPSLNEYVANCGDLAVDIGLIEQKIKELPTANPENEYYQLKIMVNKQDRVLNIPGFTYLGIDLTDETHTSSILNCGAWRKGLFKFTKKLNKFGLLDSDTALHIQQILPDEWQEDPHSFVDLWAVYAMREH
ncbi:MAG: hypothetical protein MJK04_02620 [Psychrosphaera sp.]|nr:hypothetical protein [Psychrosphaera sp.]